MNRTHLSARQRPGAVARLRFSRQRRRDQRTRMAAFGRVLAELAAGWVMMSAGSRGAEMLAQSTPMERCDGRDGWRMGQHMQSRSPIGSPDVGGSSLLHSPGCGCAHERG